MKKWLKKHWKSIAGGACAVVVAVVEPHSSEGAKALEAACGYAFGVGAATVGESVVRLVAPAIDKLRGSK